MISIRVAVCAFVLLGMGTSLQATPLETLETARQALRDGNHAVATELFQRLADENPHKGYNWAALGGAQYGAGDYEQAASSWERSLELGYRPGYMMFNLACANSRLGKLEMAIDWIAMAYTNGFVDSEMMREDSDLDALRDNPRFNQITGLRPDPSLDRTARWRHDIQFMHRRMEQVHWNLYANVSEEEFVQRTKDLAESVPQMTDNEVLTELRKIVVLAGDGHTNLQSSSETVFPVDLFWFEEGVFVRGAREQDQVLVGKRVVGVGNQTIEEAIDSVRPLISRDNDMWIRQMVPGMLRNPGYLSALGITPSADHLDLTLETESGKRETVRIDAVQMSGWHGVKRAFETNVDSAPLYLRDRSQNYWFTHLESENLIYFQYNSVGDQGDESIADFTQRLFDYIEAQTVEHLVLDIRFNHGGNSYLNRPLLQRILSSRINERGKFWVVIGRGTFSAAQNFASDLDFRTHALFVGEPTGSRPNFVGETSIIFLPYSKTRISVSSRYHQHSASNDYRNWIPADVAAPPTWVTYVSGEDPALKAILAEVKMAQP